MKHILSTLIFLFSLVALADGWDIVVTPTENIPSEDINSISEPEITGLVILGDYFARDEQTAYVINETRDNWIPLPADVASFEVIRGRFAQDRDHIFYLGNILENVDRGSFSVISGRYGYAADNTYVYSPNGVIPEVRHTDTFRLLTSKYGIDDGHVFFEGRPIDADPVSFSVVNEWLYATDATQVFYDGKLLPGIPSEGLQVEWERAFASDGHVLFEWKVEKWDPFPDDVIDNNDSLTGTENTDNGGDDIIDTDDENVSKTHILWWLTPDLLGLEWTSWENLFTQEMRWISWSIYLCFLIIWAFFIVLFSRRADQKIGFVRALITIFIADVWAAILFLGLRSSMGWVWSVILATSIAWLWVAWLLKTGLLRGIGITLASLLATIAVISILTLVARVFFANISETSHWLQTGINHLYILFWLIWVFAGASIIHSQMKTSLLTGFFEAIIITGISLIILFLTKTIFIMSHIEASVLFVICYGIILWLLHFRHTNSLVSMTARTVRVLIGLSIMLFLVLMWI